MCQSVYYAKEDSVTNKKSINDGQIFFRIFGESLDVRQFGIPRTIVN